MLTNPDRPVLETRMQAAEEVNFIGIKTPVAGGTQANAIQITLCMEHPLALEPLSLDITLHGAPVAERNTLVWDRLKPPSAWPKDPATAFDYYLFEENLPPISYAFYHNRRGLPNGMWTTLTLPLSDFICAYGQQGCADWCQSQRGIQSDEILAIGLVSSFRQARGETRILISDVSLVNVPETSSSRRSWWQHPPDNRPQLERNARGARMP